jgi:hypothetical protein
MKNGDMSKKYKDLLCAYCAEATSTTADHVVAREFFLEHQRSGLPKAPSCTCCNNEKSQLEHYLTAVLPFGGRHQDAAHNLVQMVPKRLQRNQRLSAELAAGINAADRLPIDADRVERLFVMIAQGLAWHHWRILLRSGYSIKGAMISDAYPEFIARLFRSNARDRVRVDLGGGTFCYEGVQGLDLAELTLWRMSMYGAGFASDSGLPASTFLAMTGPQEEVGKLWPKLIGEEIL